MSLLTTGRRHLLSAAAFGDQALGFDRLLDVHTWIEAHHAGTKPAAVLERAREWNAEPALRATLECLQMGLGFLPAARTWVHEVARALALWGSLGDGIGLRLVLDRGQGAPLVPAFHQAVFSAPGQARAIVNIGGMANLTLLPGNESPVIGFDSGPGNVLMDSWCRKHTNQPYDKNGGWAARGTCQPALLDRLLEHPFLKQAPPKSTGREMFHQGWLDEQLNRLPEKPQAVDVQRTLLEFTARTICDALKTHAGTTRQLLVCGGGAHNTRLMQRLAAQLDGVETTSTEAFGIHPDWVEAVAFAWLAQQTLQGKPGNLPAVTGASHPVVLGAVYPG